MTWKKVNNSDPGDSDHFGGDDGDKISDLFSGVDVDDVNINSDWTFRNGKLFIRNPANTFSYSIVPAAIGADRNLNLPLITGTDTLASLGLAQTFSAAQTFGPSFLKIRNPADTFSYTVVPAAIAADRNLNLPLITGTDTLASLGLAQTFTAAQTFGANLVVNKDLHLTGVISPSQITGTQNDYNPTNFLTSNVVRLDGNSSFQTITGLGDTTQTDGHTVKLRNISSNSILLANQNTGSTAGNRFDFNGYDLPLFPKTQIELTYDGTLSRWVVTNQPLIVPPPHLGFYYSLDGHTGTNSDTMLYTAASGGTTGFTNTALNHPGVSFWTLGTSGTGSGGMRPSSTMLILGNSWYWRYDCILKINNLSSASDNYTLRVGFIESLSGESTDGLFFKYNHSLNSGKWQNVSRDNGSETTSDSGITVQTPNFTRLTIIVNPAGNSAQFYVDGTAAGSALTALPTGSTEYTGFGLMFVKTAGTTDIGFLNFDSMQVIGYAPTTTARNT